MDKKQFLKLKPQDGIIHREHGIWVKNEEGDFSCINDGSIAELNPDDVIRRTVTQDEISEVIDRIGFITTIQAPNEKVRKEFYQQSMRKYDEIEWVRVIKSAYLHGKDQRLQPYEEEYSKRASDYFHGEIAFLLNIAFTSVEAYIAEKVTSDDW